ncbi:hypothetical protein MMYC01_210001, partial [Madurella mycetomatis]
HIDPNAILSESLSASSFDISLSDLSFPSGIQHQLSRLNTALHAVFVFHVFTVSFLPSFFTPFTIANAVLSDLTTVNLDLWATMTTATGTAAAEALETSDNR